MKLVDTMCIHEPSYFAHVPQLERGSIGPNDVVLYTDTSIMNIHSCKKRIALLLESPEYHKIFYDYIATHHHLFDIVLTFDKSLLDRGQNFRLNLLGTTWIHETYRKIWPKHRLCSMIVSNKVETSGHRLRHDIMHTIKGVDVYGGQGIPLSFTTTRAFTQEHTPCHPSNQKYLAHKEYCFSIVIENCKQDYYFTEKLIDCFLCGTIPLYYGCPSIGNFFNMNGILTFNTMKECIDKVDTLTPALYEEKMDAVRDNFERAHTYLNFHLALEKN